MRTCLIAMGALLLCACGSKTGQEAAAPKVAAPAAAQPAVSDDAVAAVLESQGKPLVQLRFVLDSKPVAGRDFHLQLLASSAEPVPPLKLTTESSDLKIEPAGAVLALTTSGSSSLPRFGAKQDFTVSAGRDGLAELTVHLTSDADTPETLYVIPVLVGEPEPAGKAVAPASDKPDPAAANDHTDPQHG